MKPKRKKVQRAYLERCLYRTEGRVLKLNQKALMLRQAIKMMEDQETTRKKDKEAAVHKALHTAAITSIPVAKGGTKDASSR